MEMVAGKVKDARFLALLGRILDGGLRVYQHPAALRYLKLSPDRKPRLGLPIGNLTSQLLANAYLDGADHFVKRELEVPGYLRYMDDLTLFGDDAKLLERQARQLCAWLREHRRIELRAASHLRPTSEPTTYLRGWAETFFQKESGTAKPKSSATPQPQ